MAYILDAGALIGADRRDERVVMFLAVARADGERLRVPSGVVAQAWRGGSSQASLSRLLATVEEIPLDEVRSRKVGALLGSSKTSDVIDASLVELAMVGDTILTSDTDDITHLVKAAKNRARVLRV